MIHHPICEPNETTCMHAVSDCISRRDEVTCQEHALVNQREGESESCAANHMTKNMLTQL